MLSLRTICALINVKSVKWYICALKDASPSLRQNGNRSGRVCTAARYLSLILAPDFTAGMQRWDQLLSVFNEHGMVTVLKTTRPRNRGLGCTNRYGKISTKAALFSSYLTVKQTWQSVSPETYKLLSARMFATAGFLKVCDCFNTKYNLLDRFQRERLQVSSVLTAVGSGFSSHIPHFAFKRKIQVVNRFSWHFLNLFGWEYSFMSLPSPEKLSSFFSKWESWLLLTLKGFTLFSCKSFIKIQFSLPFFCGS